MKQCEVMYSREDCIIFRIPYRCIYKKILLKIRLETYKANKNKTKQKHSLQLIKLLEFVQRIFISKPGFASVL